MVMMMMMMTMTVVAVPMVPNQHNGIPQSSSEIAENIEARQFHVQQKKPSRHKRRRRFCERRWCRTDKCRRCCPHSWRRRCRTSCKRWLSELLGPFFFFRLHGRVHCDSLFGRLVLVKIGLHLLVRAVGLVWSLLACVVPLGFRLRTPRSATPKKSKHSASQQHKPSIARVNKPINPSIILLMVSPQARSDIIPQ